MELQLFQVDAFANKVFEGNPAAVCPLTEWLPDEVMQNIAAENNLAETAFFVVSNDRYHIRWFTPLKEVDLCGHATLASAHVLFEKLGYDKDEIVFDSHSGPLRVRRVGSWLEMNFPTLAPEVCECPASLVKAFGLPQACLKAMDYHLIFDNEATVIEANPDFSLLKEVDLRAVSISAPGSQHDFVARLFAPKYGIDEDPVTGSLYTQLTPFWSGKFNKLELVAKQASAREGEVRLALAGDRVMISGRCVDYLSGSITI